MAKLPVGTLIPIGAIGTAKAEHVLSPNTFSSDSGVDLVGTMRNNGTVNRTLSNQGDIFNINKGYYDGGQIKVNITNLKPEYIKKGINIGGVVGTLQVSKYKKDVRIGEHTDYKTTKISVPGIIMFGTVSGGESTQSSDHWCVFDVNTGRIINGGRNLYLERVTKTKPNEIEVRTYKYEDDYETIVDLIIEV